MLEKYPAGATEVSLVRRVGSRDPLPAGGDSMRRGSVKGMRRFPALLPLPAGMGGRSRIFAPSVL